MSRSRSELRPNWYPDGPYEESTCIWCLRRLKHTGATSGTTWVPVETPPDGRPSEWWTCWSNEVDYGAHAFGQHEPWEAVPLVTRDAQTRQAFNA